MQQLFSPPQHSIRNNHRALLPHRNSANAYPSISCSHRNSKIEHREYESIFIIPGPSEMPNCKRTPRWSEIFHFLVLFFVLFLLFCVFAWKFCSYVYVVFVISLLLLVFFKFNVLLWIPTSLSWVWRHSWPYRFVRFSSSFHTNNEPLVMGS